MFMAKYLMYKKLQLLLEEITQQRCQQMMLLSSMRIERKYVIKKFKKSEIVYLYQSIVNNN